MSDYEKGYADGFNARKIVPVAKLKDYNICGNCGEKLGKYKHKGYKYCPYCGVKLK